MLVSALVTAYLRTEATLDTLERLSRLSPVPDEILVHVDGGRMEVAKAIAAHFPMVRLSVSTERVGPGGARNKLLAQCRAPFAVSFDDDSYPLDADFCDRVVKLFETYPRAAILAADVFHKGEKITGLTLSQPRWVDSFPGGGCAYRRSTIMTTTGYVPLPVAYGMEEVDLSLRLIDQGHQILHAPVLRVFHDTDRARHADPEVTAASIANIALLAYLRYPPTYWWLGVAQLASRVFWLISMGRISGIAAGIVAIPGHLLRYRHHRAPVSLKGMRRARLLRRMPEQA